MIYPTPKDVGRRVKLKPHNAPPMVGVLKEVGVTVPAINGPWGRVLFPDMKQPVVTDISKLDWADLP